MVLRSLRKTFLGQTADKRPRFSKELTCISKNEESTCNFKFSEVNAVRKWKGRKSLLFSIERIIPLNLKVLFVLNTIPEIIYSLTVEDVWVASSLELPQMFAAVSIAALGFVRAHFCRQGPESGIGERRPRVCCASVSTARQSSRVAPQGAVSASLG